MELLHNSVLNRVVGGMMNGSPGTGNKDLQMDPSSHVEVDVGGIKFSGTAGDLAAGWQALKADAVAAGWTAAAGVTLVEAGIVCDAYSDWAVCTDAQDQVDFVLDQ
nr:hypothetical protein [Luteibacter rhizovicinus]